LYYGDHRYGTGFGCFLRAWGHLHFNFALGRVTVPAVFSDDVRRVIADKFEYIRTGSFAGAAFNAAFAVNRYFHVLLFLYPSGNWGEYTARPVKKSLNADGKGKNLIESSSGKV
jgi:hypothetical protein